MRVIQRIYTHTQCQNQVISFLTSEGIGKDSRHVCIWLSFSAGNPHRLETFVFRIYAQRKLSLFLTWVTMLSWFSMISFKLNFLCETLVHGVYWMYRMVCPFFFNFLVTFYMWVLNISRGVALIFFVIIEIAFDHTSQFCNLIIDCGK